MDKRDAHRSTGTIDAHPASVAEVRPPARAPSIDGPGPQDPVDLTKVLQAIAARIDVVLDEKAAAGAESDGRHRAAQAWSSVVGKRITDGTSELRRQALATTVLRISADGRLDLDDRHPEAADSDVPEPGRAVDVPVNDVPSEPPSPAATVRSDVEDRLSAVRKRLAARHARTSASRVEFARPRASRIRRPGGPRTEMSALVKRLLIGLAVVAASAIVSILLS